MRLRGAALGLLILFFAGAAPADEQRRKKNCRRLCEDAITACVAEKGCLELPRRRDRRRCKRSCKTEILRTCRLDTDRTRCVPPPPVTPTTAVTTTTVVNTTTTTLPPTAASETGGLKLLLSGPAMLHSTELARLGPRPDRPASASAGKCHGGTSCELPPPDLSSLPHVPRVGSGLPQSPVLTTSWKASISVHGGHPADAQVAASRTHVIVTDRQKMAFFSKAGTKVKEPDPVDFFAPLRLVEQGLTTPGRAVNDLRVLFDGYRNRFWIVGSTGNSTIDPVRGIYTIAVSTSENPLDPWCLYWTDAVAEWNVPNSAVYKKNDAGDYPLVGIDPKLFHLTSSVAGEGGYRYWRVAFFPADDLASCRPGPINGWQFWDLKDPNGKPTHIIQPVVHHGITGRSYYVSTHPPDGMLVWSLTAPLTPAQSLERVTVDLSASLNGELGSAPQKGSADVLDATLGGTAGGQSQVMKAVYRLPFLYAAVSDSQNWTGSGALSSIRLMRFSVIGFPNVSIDPLLGAFDRRFGLNASDDPPGTEAHYFWPAVEVNRHHSAAVVYSRSGFDHFPEVRFSTYLDGEPDIRPSRLLKAGESPFGAVPGSGAIRGWGDTAGASVDPKDDTAIWMAQEYANAAGGYDIWVGKVFGIRRPDFVIKELVFSPALVPSGGSFEVSGEIENQGDGNAKDVSLGVFLCRDDRCELTGSVAVDDPLPAGRSVPYRATIAVAASARGMYEINVVADVVDRFDEYSDENNALSAPGRLEVR